ncbi:maleylpyruvate isomerase family mycothiol-dependent enzyme [Mycobacterium sp. GA-0227b]|uniref:maleylpyruvate isomerase family mycothiol-dependent enzyme n=2 Tax=unclassified Mycobacterium TaxID=2642494 RepID=UPI000ADEB75A|nr:maleylpyruvate isomerase family mycothiol-dependent enzyme [Mycobacterium sp. GA-0227b]
MSLASEAGPSFMPNDVWPLVHAERRALIADLERLDDAQWAQPSLCAGWSVHDVAAHMVDVATTTRLGFIVAMAKARFDFDRQNAQGIERARGATPQQTLQRLRAVAARTSTPPAPLDTRIVEEVLHGEDIRRPLGLTRAYPQEAVARSLHCLAGMSAKFGGAKELVARVRLSATDFDLSVGDGPEVRAPALDLLLAASGRHTPRVNLTTF